MERTTTLASKSRKPNEPKPKRMQPKPERDVALREADKAKTEQEN